MSKSDCVTVSGVISLWSELKWAADYINCGVGKKNYGQ